MFDVGRWTFDVRLGIRHYRGHLGVGQVPFPLTPALSLGEREQLRRLCKQTKAAVFHDAADVTPYPKGRGIKGEGELAIEWL